MYRVTSCDLIRPSTLKEVCVLRRMFCSFLFLLKEQLPGLPYEDAQKNPICATHCAGSALSVSFKHRFIRFTHCALSRADG